MILWPDGDLGSRVGKLVHILHIIILHGNTAKRPVLIAVYHKIFMRPGAVDADAATDAGIGRYFTTLLSLVEFFITLLCRIIQ